MFESDKLCISDELIDERSKYEIDDGKYDTCIILLEGRIDVSLNKLKYSMHCGDLLFVPRNECLSFLLDPEEGLGKIVKIQYKDDGSQKLFHISDNNKCNIFCSARLPSYEPKGHINTTNKCLFVNENIEVIRGRIDVGGGAFEHVHDELDQFVYVISPGPSQILRIPRGTKHGTGGSVQQVLDLIVIYSPPLRESQLYNQISV